MSKESVISDADVPQDVLDAIADGRRVVAIKLLRDATGLGLANAKVVVDRLALTHGPKIGSQVAVRDRLGQIRSVLLLALLAGAVAAWRILYAT